MAFTTATTAFASISKLALLRANALLLPLVMLVLWWPLPLSLPFPVGYCFFPYDLPVPPMVALPVGVCVQERCGCQPQPSFVLLDLL